MNPSFLRIGSRKYSAWIFAFALLFLASCAHLTSLDRAQDAFSKGADLENKALFGQTAAGPASPETYYTLAYGEVKNALRSKGKLARVGVLGSAWSLKALCEWKLKDYEAARKSAKVAKENLLTGPGRPELRRDYAVMEALDGLIGIERANDDLYVFFREKNPSAEEAKSKYNQLIFSENEPAQLQRAMDELETVYSRVANKHEVRIYLKSAQLAGLKVWSDALDLVRRKMQSERTFSGTNSDWFDTEESRFLDKKAQYLKDLGNLLPGKKEHPLYDYWNKLL
ncbi:MAG: hypothetical protein D6714_13570 [Bacteroidetes bacterium]|nr:MAG: hypothetical protein D6714_13570 [Bacteroidota bacterium]